MQEIQFTKAAQDYIKTMLEKNNGKAFRLSIKKTGCSGYSYHPEIVNSISATDIQLNIADMTILVDASWLHLLEGIQVDYVEEVKSGLKQKRLVIANPKESTRCGCGESFHVENDRGQHAS